MENLYRPTSLENAGIMDSYNNLGGLAGTGFDFNTWKTSMGIGDVDKGVIGNTMDFLGSDAGKGVLGVAGLGKDLLGGYFTWKNSQDMKDIMNREVGMKEDMWNEQKSQIAQFNADKKKLNQGYSGLASTAV